MPSSALRLGPMKCQEMREYHSMYSTMHSPELATTVPRSPIYPHRLRMCVFYQVAITCFATAFTNGSEWWRGYVLPTLKLSKDTYGMVRFNSFPNLQSTHIEYNILKRVCISESPIEIPCYLHFFR